MIPISSANKRYLVEIASYSLAFHRKPLSDRIQTNSSVFLMRFSLHHTKPDRIRDVNVDAGVNGKGSQEPTTRETGNLAK